MEKNNVRPFGPRTSSRHYHPWEDDDELELDYRIENFILETARDMGRSVGSIRNRMKMKGFRTVRGERGSR